MILKRAGIGGLALAILLASGLAWAGRPLDTEDTGTVEPGKAELELSLNYAKNPDDNTWSTLGVVSFGVFPRFEARVELPVLLVEPEDEKSQTGIGDTLVGFKYRLLDERAALPALLGSLTLRLPTGDADRGLGSEDVDVGLLGVISKSVGPLTFFGNLGYTFVTRDDDPNFWTFNAALEYRATQSWSLVGEVVSAVSDGKGADTVVLRLGSGYAVTDRIKLDGAVGFGVTKESPDVILTVGVAIAF